MKKILKIFIFAVVFTLGGVTVTRADTTYTCYNTCSPVYSNWVGRVILDLQCNGSSPASYTGSLTVNGVSLSYSKTCIVASPGVCGGRSTTYPAGTPDWPGGSAYCSNGSALSTPAFPTYGATVNWSCSGVNGGSSVPCSATQNLAAPTVQLNVSPLNISLNNSSATISPKTVDLNWNVTNSGIACGAGCTCQTSGEWGTNPKPYPSSLLGFNIGTAGSKTFTLTCTNPQGASGSDSKTVTVGCDPFSWTDPNCNTLCGPGNYMQHSINNLCVTTDSIGPACVGNPNCPAGTTFEEVRP